MPTFALPHSAFRLLLGAALTLSAARAADEVIARVGDMEIKVGQVKPYLANISPQEREALAKNPNLLSQSVRSLILQQILFKEAVAAGWDKTPDVVEQLERLRQTAIAESYIQSISKVPENFPSDEEIKSLYEARKDDLKIPRQLRLAQIFIAVSKGTDKPAQEKAKAQIDEITKAVKAGDFSAVAREKSDERETATRGGDVGWLPESQIQPEIRSHISGLGKGATTEPVRLADGWYIVRILDVKEAHTAALDEVKEQLAHALRADRLRANREAYLGKLQQQNPIALDELGLAKLLKHEP